MAGGGRVEIQLIQLGRGFFQVRVSLYAVILAQHLGHRMENMLKNPVRNLMDHQNVEFWASYKYGIATDLTESHLDDDKAGLNPLLLAPEELSTQNTPRSTHTACRCDCITKTKFGVVIGLPKCQKQCGNRLQRMLPIRYKFTRG
jgi:hypothetical protein